MNKIIIKSAILAALFFLSAGVTVLAGSFIKGNAPVAKSTADTATADTAVTESVKTTAFETTAPTTEETVYAYEETEAETTAPIEINQPEELTEYLNRGNLTYEQLSELSCSQLIVVNSSGISANISMYEMNTDGEWSSAGLDTTGFVGDRGVSFQSSEGSHETPGGFYPIGSAFYIDSKPLTGLDSFRITNDTYWVDDPASEYYNCHVEGVENKDWNSAEHMIDYSSYRYGFVIDFNTNPIVKGKGSAIFFHVGGGPTLGCVATSEGMVLSYLEKLNASQSPYILIL